MTKDKPTPKLPQTPWYKKAVLPWVVIIIMATSLASFIGGWNARSAQLTTSDVQHIVQIELEEYAAKNTPAKK